MYENRVLRRIFEPKRDHVTGEWRKVHNEELGDLYSSLSIFRVTISRRKRLCSTCGGQERRCIYRVLVGKYERKRPLGRASHRWEDDESSETEMWGHKLDRSGSGQGHVAGTCECGNGTMNPIKCGEFLD
jgi:hypothetical protein